MSVFDKLIKCKEAEGLSFDQIAALLMVQHADGTKGFNMMFVTVTDCDNLSAIDCSKTPINLLAEFRDRIYLDACNRPALVFFNTVAAT